MKSSLISTFLTRVKQSLILVVGVMTLVFCSMNEAFSAELSNMSAEPSTVVEVIHLHVPQELRTAWLKAERESWEPWLASKKGFEGRQLFWDKERENAILLITWASYSQWKAIPQEEIESVQELFEQIARDYTGRKFGNPFPVRFEGELLPQ